MVDIPLFEHHETARKILREAVNKKEMSMQDADKYFYEWRKRRQISGNLKKAEEGDPELKEIEIGMGMSDEDFTQAYPVFFPPFPAYAEANPIIKRLVCMFGPTTHNRHVWSVLHRIVATTKIPRPMALESYRIWGAAVRSLSMKRRKT